MNHRLEYHEQKRQPLTPLKPKLLVTMAFWVALLCNCAILGYLILTVNSIQFGFDSAILHFGYFLRSQLLTQFFEIITTFGYSTLIVLITIVVIYLLYLKEFTSALWVAGTTMLGGQLNSAIKSLVARIRPHQMPLITANDYSFPSGHAMAAIIFYGLIIYLINAVYPLQFSNKTKILVSALCISLIVLIGASRVYLGVHYPSDILGAYSAGYIWLSLAVFVHYHIQKITALNEQK